MGKLTGFEKVCLVLMALSGGGLLLMWGAVGIGVATGLLVLV